jgi:hypothetical protein
MDFIKDTIFYLFKQLSNKDQIDVQTTLNDFMVKIKTDNEKNMELTYEKIYDIAWC